MYSVVLMMALSGSASAPECGRQFYSSCQGSNACSGQCRGGCYGSGGYGSYGYACYGNPSYDSYGNYGNPTGYGSYYGPFGYSTMKLNPPPPATVKSPLPAAPVEVGTPKATPATPRQTSSLRSETIQVSLVALRRSNLCRVEL